MALKRRINATPCFIETFAKSAAGAARKMDQFGAALGTKNRIPEEIL
ncbi:hypothetical protein [Tabrizicola oligotrophica]|uniref:Uncharacterized protein n=1 Tax=Tabrizicola oligotrophica TaxID=2710650 RepID=A0A6M0QWT8_9RHOB|nr:hypothetical protein [Tabrizicola oligotrophica]NEY91847.1 hypothetical protein [Tabrizicola oligotrophica]